MPQIDRIGLFKGEITDFGVSETSQKKYPQFIATFLATAFYNEVNETWDDWTQFEGQTITGYFVLVRLDEHGNVVKCFHYDNIMEAVGWDGESYSSLATMDLKGKHVQFRVIEDNYKSKTTDEIKTIFKVNHIAAEDAETGLRKLSGKDLTKLDAEFGVASVKKNTPATPKKGGKKPTASKTPAAPKPPTTKATTEIESCTEQDAYNACIAANNALKTSVPDDILNDYWVTQVQEIAADFENVTNEEWPKIRDAVINDCEIKDQDNIPF